MLGLPTEPSNSTGPPILDIGIGNQTNRHCGPKINPTNSTN